MSEKIRVLIVDDVATTRENILKLIQFHPEMEAVGQAANGEEALLQAKSLRPDIVLMDINMPRMDGITATEKMTVEVPEASILIMSVQGEQEYLRRAMMAGAKNYLTKPFTGDELMQAVKEAYQRERRVRDAIRASAGVKNPGQVISVFSGKGGVGKTLIAVNMAVALSNRPATKVAVVDADIQFGDVALFLNLFPRTTLADVLPDLGHLDEKILSAYLTSFKDSLQVLAAPLRPEQADTVTGALVGSVLKQLRDSHDYIIVDTSTAFNEVTIAVLDASDLVLVVTGPDLPTVKNAKLSLDILHSLGYKEEKIRLVLNCPHSEGDIDLREVEESLKKKAEITIPTDVKSVIASINTGMPLVSTRPDNMVARKIVALADRLAPGESATTGASEKPAKRFNLFGR